MKPLTKPDPVTEALYMDAEERDNIVNLKFLAVMAACELICIPLNELGIFIVDRVFLTISMLTGAALCLLPILTWLIHDRIQKRRPSICRAPWFKRLIISLVSLTTALLCVTLSVHAVALMAVPALIAAQYRSRRSRNAVMLVMAVLLVLLSVYGAFFYGIYDRNLHKGILSAEEATFAARAALVTPQYMLRLFTHYALPRMICLVVVTALATGISRRNGDLLTRQVELSENIRRQMAERNAMQSHVIDELAALIETRDGSTGGHVNRTKRYVELIAREMQRRGLHTDVLSDEAVERIVNAAPLHDIGKIAVPDRILQKPGRLTPEEFEEMKLHAAKGGEMVRSILGNLDDKAFLQTASEIATSHHERWDGKGYPNRIADEAIPLPARIMSVADVFDALVSERCYKQPMPPDEAFRIIEEERGRQFDPEIIDLIPALRSAFLRVMEQKE